MQHSLFDDPAPRVEGLHYQSDWLTPAAEAELLKHIKELPFAPFQFHGFVGKRRTVSFGTSYDFSKQGLQPAPAIPPFLDELRHRAATFAQLPQARLRHALVIEYEPGAGIGWHRDKDVFGEVIGISLLSPCTFRLRRRVGAGWERNSFIAAPRSIYHLSGAARRQWEHSVPPVGQPRYSITFRTLLEE